MAPSVVSGGEFKPRVRVRTGLLELIVVVTYAGLVSYYPTIQQYLFHRMLDEKREIGASHSHNGTSSLGNSCYNNTSEEQEAEEMAERESAEWLLYIGLSNAVPGIFSTLVIGAITDSRGRKLGMVIPTVGTMIKMLLTMLVVKLNWPLYVLLIAGFLDGCLGSFGTCFVAALAYLADVTEPGKTRTFRITIVQALNGVCASAVSLGTGYFIRAAGFFYPLVVALVLFTLVVFLVVLFLPETVEPSDDPIMSFNRLTSTVKTYIKPREGNKRPQLMLLLLAYLLLEMVLIGKGVLSTLFQMGFPFCWRSVKLGIWSAVGTTVQVSCMLLLLRPLTRCVHENVVGVFGLLSEIGELLMTGLAVNDVMLFFAPIAGFLSSMPASMIKSVSSLLVGPNEQGSLFAGISSIQLICFTFGSSLFNTVYASTVSSFPGLVYLVMSCLIFLTCVMMGAVEVLRRKSDQTAYFQPIPTVGEDSDVANDGDVADNN
ncbi:lysosomal proton-coupled steroid conjugate and bile acid symporter SLC46A3-like [Liolophura sinensis]|uniref:lysosomal proton-coupled steroid conjugate and bile acid symporter SLC46A3-like n=1 Tax=Liolophura sinensis TaxID=3198878 RepID=UPI0031594031